MEDGAHERSIRVRTRHKWTKADVQLTSKEHGALPSSQTIDLRAVLCYAGAGGRWKELPRHDWTASQLAIEGCLFGRCGGEDLAQTFATAEYIALVKPLLKSGKENADDWCAHSEGSTITCDFDTRRLLGYTIPRIFLKVLLLSFAATPSRQPFSVHLQGYDISCIPPNMSSVINEHAKDTHS